MLGGHQKQCWPDKVHDDVIKWKNFLRYWPFVRGIHRSPVNSPHKGQWRGALMFSVICAWINDWVNNREAGDLRSHRAHYDVIVMYNWLWIMVPWPVDIFQMPVEILPLCTFRSCCAWDMFTALSQLTKINTLDLYYIGKGNGITWQHQVTVKNPHYIHVIYCFEL